MGWFNYLTGKNNDLVQQRGEVCIQCDNIVHKEYLEVINEEVEIIKGYVCDVCSCPLSSKLRVKQEVCPLGKW